MSININLHHVSKIVLGVPRRFSPAEADRRPFVWQAVTFHMQDGTSVTVDCCAEEVEMVPVECRKSYKLLDALNHHTAVQLREMAETTDSARETAGAALQGTGG